MEKFYITTTLPYVNAEPHIGFALELVQADIIARYQKQLGKEVFFNTGTDEHGSKIYNKAKEEGEDTQAYADEYAAKFKELIPALGISSDIHFIRTTDEYHIKACQEFWKLCDNNGYIEKKEYKIKYCVGCELEKTDSELVEGKCPLHPNLELEIREEENYFFKFSKFGEKLQKLYHEKPDFVVPDFRFNEIKEFVSAGLQDFSISRLKSKMPWGVEVPGDADHVMYVWFDALVNYISTLGWPASAEASAGKPSDFNQWWGTSEHPNGVQIAGKDNLRQQSAMWQAMLMAAGLPNSKQIIIHGFITSNGQKMSKSLGNVANPYDIKNKLISLGLSDEQATDALRYYLAREISTFEDGDYTWEHFKETYNANLANGLGNLVSRVMKMAVNNGIGIENFSEFAMSINPKIIASNKYLGQYDLKVSIDCIWAVTKEADVFIQMQEPFKKIKVDKEKAVVDIKFLLKELYDISVSLKPFLPVTSEKILAILKDPKLENIPHLFPRIE